MNVEYGATKPCLHCGLWRPIEQFPLANPRADGARSRFQFCSDCWSVISAGGVRTPEDKRAISRQTKRESRFRRRRQTGRWR